jgi:hypothetical protein
VVVPRALVLAALALALAPAAHAATAPTQPVYDKFGHIVQIPFTPVTPAAAATPKHSSDQITQIFLDYPKVASWLTRYPTAGRQTQATDKDGIWTVNVWWGKAGEIATGTVDDATGAVTAAWTGPQVAWHMARGYGGAFGGREINSYKVWLSFCGIFLLGLVPWRKPFSLRTLDLLALLSFSVSLWFFNHGDVFQSAILAYPPLVYLLGRALYGVRRPARAEERPVWPVWILAAATIFLVGFRIGLNVSDSNVIDVGYAGVIGADRISHGQMPYGNFPVEDDLKPCGPADANGEIRDRIQTNGRCESANPLGDTYGPISYDAYLPGYWIMGWSGKWDDLPAVHFTSILWDVLAIIGLFLVGRRYGGIRLAVTLAFAWAAFPFTQYASMSNTNDAIMPTLLIFGFWLVSNDAARGIFCALGGWTKFASFVVAPLWLTYPEWRRPRRYVTFVAGFAVATIGALSILFLDPHVGHAFRVFWDRTVWTQLTRHSPFSLWDWQQYYAKGIPNLHAVQKALYGVLGLGALAAARWPRRKTPLQLAALTLALLVGLQITLTYWVYLYIPWFFPFAAIVVLAPAPAPAAAAETEAEDERGLPELAAAG